MDNRVCTRCIGDEDLKAWIQNKNGPRGCDFCRTYVASTVTVTDLCEHMESCICNYWGTVIDQVSWDSQEGGYQAVTWDTWEIVFDEIGLDLPLDSSGDLYQAILQSLSDEVWCDYDWLCLDEDEAMKLSWSKFCEVVKHQRRFFFQMVGYDPEDLDSIAPLSMLNAIAAYSERHRLIRTLNPGTRLYRARPNFNMKNPPAKEFGPPPRSVCQSNRMNPAGVPMFYGALDKKTAVLEVKALEASVGYFQTAIPLRVLDLTKLPKPPGYFADVARSISMELRFLNQFKTDIMQPIDRDDRVHTEYVPSQIVTEFLRDYEFRSGKLAGIMYGSVASPGKNNVVLFLDTLTPEGVGFHSPPPHPLTFIHARKTRLDS